MPTVVAAAAAPAEAASPPPRIDRLFLVTRGTAGAGPGTTVTACGSGSTRLSVTTDDVNTYYRIVNVQAGSTVTDVTASVLVEKDVVDAMARNNNPLTWTNTTTTDWSNPTREVSGTGSPVLYPNNGTQYYRYYSTLKTAVPAPVSGTITLPRIGWYSNCSRTLAQSTGVSVNGRGSAVVNGKTLVNVGNFRTV
ncbi:hypothetical protein M3B78_008890 [Micrococcus luteus]|uniref:hypothetical protein n=1 Tax=Micrococcus luteus TaxID=1270 RepID=UPI0016425467|nr:hypothetical protein [Micrococcus luteus]MCV7597753.1 hypothetical protein [Micrococcus luteus]